MSQPLAVSIIQSGASAYRAGLKLADNPFANGSPASSYWSEGYCNARREGDHVAPVADPIERRLIEIKWALDRIATTLLEGRAATRQRRVA